ncbi:MAG: ABC transporter substrate-binding protein [Campylobacterota bacterium]
MRHLLFLTVILTQLFSAQEPEKVTLQLQWYHQFQFAGYYMAKEKGFYAEAGLDVEINEVNVSTDIVTDVLQKEGRYATGRTSLIIDRANGKKVVALAAILQASPIVIVTKERPDIQTVEDLAGKHVDSLGSTIDSVVIRGLLNAKSIKVERPYHDHVTSRLESLIDDHADAIVVYSTNEIYQLTEREVKYRMFRPRDHGFDFYSDILFSSENEVKNHPKRAAGFKSASLRGWEYAFTHIDETVELILNKYNTQHKSREALVYEANALRKLAYYRTDKVGKIDRSKMLEIYDAYQKISQIGDGFDVDDFVFEEGRSKQLILTSEEQAYLQTKKEITLCGFYDWLPFMEYKNERPEGMIVDHARAYEQMIGLPLRFVRTTSWNECIERTKEKKIDVAVPVFTELNQHEHLTPTKSFEKDHLVLITKIEVPFISDIGKASPKTASIRNGSSSFEHFVRSRYENISFVYVENMQEGMDNVISGKTNLYIDALIPTSFYISRYYPNRLKVNSRVPGVELNGAFGIRSDEPMLASILNKAIDTLSLERKREIYNSWISVKHENETDYMLIWKILLGAGAVVLVFGYRQYILRREHKKLQTAYLKIQQQQLRLREQQNFHKLIFDNATDGVLILEHGRFTDCNQAIVKMLKYEKKEELLGLHPAQLSPKYQPDGSLSADKTEEMMALAYKNGGHRFEWVHTKATEEEFWVEVVLTPIIIDKKKILHVVWRDISKRKKLEYENVELNNTLKTKIDTVIADLKKSQAQAKLGSWKHDLVKNQLTWSDETYTIFERQKTSEVVEYDDFLAAIHPDDIERVNTAYTKSLDIHEAYALKYRLLMPDGRIKYVKEQCETSFDDSGEALISVGTIQDITVEHLTNEKLRHKDEILFKQSRLALMGEMLSMIAHQWRQPLAAISATSATIELKANGNRLDNETAKQKARDISKFSQHLSNTIEDFRSFFKPNREKDETTYDALVASALSIIEVSIANRNIQLLQELNCHETFSSYPNELKQVILNLIKNAEDALLEKAVEEPFVKITTYKQEEQYILEVSDNAGGIPEEIIESIFDPYFSTKKAKDGTGLGLYMSKTIIEEHCGGELHALNSSEGAVFRVIL